MVSHRTLGALCAVLAGARGVLADEPVCSPVTVTEYCTVSVLEKITALVHSTLTVTGSVTGTGAVVTDTVSVSASTLTVPYNTTVTASLYSNVSITVTKSESSSSASLSSSLASSSIPSSVSASPSSSAPASSSSSSPASSSAPATSVALPSACVNGAASSTGSATGAGASSSAGASSGGVSNSGIDFAYFTDDYENDGDDYASFDIESFKTRTPEYSGVTTKMGLDIAAPPDDNPTYGSIYGSSDDLQLEYFALNHHTYLFAVEAGEYTITAFNVDDALWVWVGADAYSGYTRDNAAMSAVKVDVDNTVNNTYAFTAAAGDYVPLRFVYAQGQGEGSFGFTLTSPSGQTLVSSDTTDSPYIFRYSCDLVSAPKFPAYGEEA